MTPRLARWTFLGYADIPSFAAPASMPQTAFAPFFTLKRRR